jgi:CDP-diacylglycerol--glycerol-3-phosphate 3-phosphatidyltransferase
VRGPNLPNIITLTRLMALPGVLWLMWPGHATPRSVFWAAIVYIFAGVLDVVDGFLARRLKLETSLGKFLDPLVDKLFYLVCLIALLQLPGTWVPPWVVMLTLMRELAITGLRGIAVGEGIVIAAGQGGKVKTSFATGGIAALIIHYPYVVDWGIGTFVVDAGKVGLVLTYISLYFSMTSALGYARGFVRAMAQSPKVAG